MITKTIKTQKAPPVAFDDIEPRGRGVDAKPIIDGSTQVVRWRECPDCGGRGWFLYEPFATSPWPAGYVVQCQTCAGAKAFYDANGRLPVLAEKANSVVSGNAEHLAAPSSHKSSSASIERAVKQQREKC